MIASLIVLIYYVYECKAFDSEGGILAGWYERRSIPKDPALRPPRDWIARVATTTTAYAERWRPVEQRLRDSVVLDRGTRAVSACVAALSLLFCVVYVAAACRPRQRTAGNRVAPSPLDENPLVAGVDGLPKVVGARAERHAHRTPASSVGESISGGESGPRSSPSTHSSDEFAGEVVRRSGGFNVPGHPLPLCTPLSRYRPMSYRTASDLAARSHANFFSAVRAYGKRKRRAVAARAEWLRRKETVNRGGLAGSNCHLDNID